MGRPPKKELPLDLSLLLKQIGVNITSFRLQLGISQAELAKRSKISTTTLNEIETKKYRDIRLSTLTSIARSLGTNVPGLLLMSDIKLDLNDRKRLLQVSEDLSKIVRTLKSED